MFGSFFSLVLSFFFVWSLYLAICSYFNLTFTSHLFTERFSGFRFPGCFYMVFAYCSILSIFFQLKPSFSVWLHKEMSLPCAYCTYFSFIIPNLCVCVFHFNSTLRLPAWRVSLLCFVFLILFRQVLSSIFIFKLVFFPLTLPGAIQEACWWGRQSEGCPVFWGRADKTLVLPQPEGRGRRSPCRWLAFA